MCAQNGYGAIMDIIVSAGTIMGTTLRVIWKTKIFEAFKTQIHTLSRLFFQCRHTYSVSLSANAISTTPFLCSTFLGKLRTLRSNVASPGFPTAQRNAFHPACLT